jgi:formamidopyrimidine-DNA glycosylase
LLSRVSALEFSSFLANDCRVPELAEVEHSRRIWDVALGQRILSVSLPKPGDRVFRGTSTEQLTDMLPGKIFRHSEARGKQLLFRFGRAEWVGIHLGMSGDLRVESDGFQLRKHDLLILRQKKQSLVFSDVRHFGRVWYHGGSKPPEWWTKLSPSLLSDEFTRQALAGFLKRRRGAPIKAVLLMQARFPGIGNWMADEILWRARIHPSRLAGTLNEREIGGLFRAVRWVCQQSIRVMDANWHYPKSWLFRHRWELGGKCPRCRTGLQRARIGGRTTCWCPKEQRQVNR